MPVDIDAMYAGIDSSASTATGADANTAGRREGAVFAAFSGHVRTPNNRDQKRGCGGQLHGAAFAAGRSLRRRLLCRDTGAKPVLKAVGDLDWREVLQHEQSTANIGVAASTARALIHVFPHRCHLYARQRVIDKGGVSFCECFTVHQAARGRS
jgi:hypothetical protein